MSDTTNFGLSSVCVLPFFLTWYVLTLTRSFSCGLELRVNVGDCYLKRRCSFLMPMLKVVFAECSDYQLVSGFTFLIVRCEWPSRKWPSEISCMLAKPYLVWADLAVLTCGSVLVQNLELICLVGENARWFLRIRSKHEIFDVFLGWDRRLFK